MLFYLFWFLFFVRDIYASDHPYINKFSSFSSDDWVEICVPVGSQLNMSSYRVEDDGEHKKDGTDCIIAETGCYVFDMSTLLNNAGDLVILKKGDSIIDCVGYGNKKCNNKESPDLDTLVNGEYGIKTDDDWVITDNPTRSENICLLPTVIPSNTPSPSLMPTATLVLSQNFNIIISEVYPNPSQGYEWVELYNNGSQEAVLTDWKIDDQDGGGSSPYSFNAVIGVDSFIVIEIQRAGGMLNDSGDDVRLLSNQGNLIDNLSYEQINRGISYSLVGDDYCFSLPTPETDNFDCFEDEESEDDISVTPTVSPTPKPTEKTKNSPTPSLKPTDGEEWEATQSSEINIEDIVLSENEKGMVMGEKSGNIEENPSASNKNIFITLIFIGLGISILGAYYMLSKNEENSLTNN